MLINTRVTREIADIFVISCSGSMVSLGGMGRPTQPCYFDEILGKLEGCRYKKVILNLSKVVRIDSIGAGEILVFYRKLGSKLKIVLSKEVKNVFELNNFFGHPEMFCDNEEEALNS